MEMANGGHVLLLLVPGYRPRWLDFNRALSLCQFCLTVLYWLFGCRVKRFSN